MKHNRLLSLTLILTVFGLITVADASAPQAMNAFGDKYFFVKQQIIWAVVGIVGLFVVSRLPISLWRKLATPLFLINLLLLVIVLIPGVGSKLLGARRWINLGFLSLQPSELIKFTSILFFAKLAATKKNIIYYLVTIVLVTGLIMLQPDLGTTLVFVGISFVMMFVANLNIVYLLGLGIIGGMLGYLTIIFSEYRRERLMTFLKQTSDPLGSSYHIRQILLSLGQGGWLGVGLGASKQKYLFLPEAATDSIFAVIAEEIGFLGSMVIIILILLLIFEGIKIAQNTLDTFSQMVVCGIVTWIGVQTFLNIGSVTALVPLTGIPLPFFSYGGSALTTLLLSVGIVVNIERHGAKRKK